jgi:hypothetical protein
MHSDNDSSEPIEPSAAGIKREFDECRAIYASHKQTQLIFWRKLAGALVPSMLQSPHAAECHLQHASARVRIVALEVLRYRWKALERLAVICEKMALGDPDSLVQTVALQTLGRCYEGTADRRIGRLLAAAVHDDSKPTDYRRAAYLALCQLITWRSQELLLKLGLKPSGPVDEVIRFPADVDWVFVSSFLAQ